MFKNIQTFKGMPAIRVLRIMEQAFVPNLGVECGHCHTIGEWESDSKREKGIAREMWTMRGDVQQKLRQITGKATCRSPVTPVTRDRRNPRSRRTVNARDSASEPQSGRFASYGALPSTLH